MADLARDGLRLTNFSGTRDQPANHLSPPPVQRGQSYSHDLKKARSDERGVTGELIHYLKG